MLSALTVRLKAGGLLVVSALTLDVIAVRLIVSEIMLKKPAITVTTIPRVITPPVKV